MSCWRRTTVLRVPAAMLGFQYRRQWDEFLKKHEYEFDWEPGYFNESLSDCYPTTIRWSADFYNPNWHLSQRCPEHPEIVPGPFLDYCLDEIMPLYPWQNTYGINNAAFPLNRSEMQDFHHVYQGLFPDFTMKDMQAVRRCEYEWYDGSNAPYLYSSQLPL